MLNNLTRNKSLILNPVALRPMLKYETLCITSVFSHAFKKDPGIDAKRMCLQRFSIDALIHATVSQDETKYT